MNAQAEGGETPLHRAVQRNALAMVKVGCHPAPSRVPAFRRHWRYPSSYDPAGSHACAQVLLKHGAAVDAADEAGGLPEDYLKIPHATGDGAAILVALAAAKQEL